MPAPLAAPEKPVQPSLPFADINHHFSLDGVPAIVAALQANPGEWAQATLATLQQHSPLMLHVALAQIRRARQMGLADALRMERTMVRHCFSPQHLGRSRSDSETVEGIRALAIDKDHHPRWNPARIDDVTPEMVNPFFESPWPVWAHPLLRLNPSL